MNLPDKLNKLNYKKTGLAMLPVLFFLFSCEDPSEIGLDLNPHQGSISTHYVELPVASSQLFIDSIGTALREPATPARIGRMSDPYFGELAATTYTNIGLPDTVPPVASGASVDSIYLRLGFQPAYTGNQIDAPQEINVYWLQEPISAKSTRTNDDGETIRNFNYFNFDHESMEGAELVGQISFDTASVSGATLKLSLLNSSFANELFSKVKEGDRSLLTSQLDFDEVARSLAFVPGEGNTFINNYLLADPRVSRIDLYHSGLKKPISFPFLPKQDGVKYTRYPIYYGLEADYSNTALATVPEGGPKQAFEPADGRLYFRSGAGLVPRFDIPAFREFIQSDTLGEFVINQAILEIDDVEGIGDNRGVPQQLSFYFINKNNNLISSVVTSPAGGIPVNANHYITTEQDTLLRYVSSVQGPADLVRGLEQYVLNKEEEDYLRGILYPSSSVSSLQSFIAEPDKVKLKIYYTSLKDSN